MDLEIAGAWAGTESSLKAALDAEENIRLKSGAFEGDDEDDLRPRLLSVDDGIATISIR